MNVFPSRSVRLACLAVLLGSAGALAASAATDEFARAMAGDDSDAKRAALRGLAGASDTDEVILPLLIGALGDRQSRDAAIQALRSRTGLAPGATSKGGGGYPGYPTSDEASAWNTWLDARSKEKAKEAQLKQLQDQVAKAGAASAAASASSATTADTAAADAGYVPPPDLGRLDRITFKNGGSLLCYIRTKRVDADGRIVSYRVVHVDGNGEEVIAADLIAKVDEDIP